MIRWLKVLLFCVLTVPLLAQMTLTIPTTVKTANIDRIGINLGGGQTALSYYGPNQLFKNLNYAQGGDMPGFYWATTYECNPGPNSVFNWSNDIADTQGYPANFWAGATFTTVTQDTGTSIGSGTVSASSANTTYPGSGVLLEGLNPQLSRPCNATAEPPPTYVPYGDVLTARLLNPGSVALSLMTPNNFYGGFPSSSTWSSDTSPASSNTIHSLQLLTGTSASFADDAVLQNATNPNGSLAATYVPWINLNGSYSANFKAKCLTAGCTIGVSVARLSGATFVPYTVVSPTYNLTAGAGWTTYTNPFTASETGAQGSGIYYVLGCTGTCRIQDVDLIEGSTLAGNTTVFRDAVVSELEKMNPGSIRYMDSSQWCSDVADEIAPLGNRRWCGASEYVSFVQGPPIGYDDILRLANVIGSDAWISVGITNQPADWQTLITWLNTSGWTSTFAASGHKIYLEDGNEPWNTGAVSTMVDGNGVAYGGVLGLNMAAAKTATGYNSTVIKLVGDSWVAPDQGSTAFGWLNNVMQYAGCTSGTQSGCPDFVTNAPYTLNYLNNFDTTGSNVSTTGAPFLDEWAEISNIDSVTATPSDWMYASGSMYLNTTYGLSTYNIPMAVYESNISMTNGNTVTQTQMDQITGSVGDGLSQAQHALLQQRDAGVSGPINIFALAQNYFNYNDTHPPAVPMWGTMIALATGPGQAVNSANYERPVQTALDIINQAIGSNNNLIASTQSGTPTFSYAGGQPETGYAGTKNTILANASVPLVNCFVYANNAKTNWTTICFNNSLTSSETVVLSGAGAPTGTVTRTLFPQSGNSITDHNEATYVGPGSIAPVVNYPSSTSTSGTSYPIPAASMVALTYSTSGTPQAATPVLSPGSGIYFVAQTPTITSSTSGVSICYTTDGTTPTATSPGTCSHGSTLTNGGTLPSISSTQTVNAIATIASGYTNSSVNSATYTIVTAAATPTLSPNGGSFGSSQSVTMSVASPCNGYGVYNTTGTQSSGNLTGISSTTPFTVMTTSTYYTQTQSCPGQSNSPISSGISFVINTQAAPPTFSVNGPVSLPGPTLITMTSATSGAGSYIVYNLSGNQSGGNLTGVTVGNTYTVPALSTQTVYSQVQGMPGHTNSTITNSGPITTVREVWYVRTDGGTRYDPNVPAGQCNGLANVAYSGSGTNQNCAFNDFRFLYDDQTNAGAYSWVMASGDQVVIEGCGTDSNQPYNASPACRVGWDNNVSPGNGIWAKGRSNGGAHPPPLPSGTSTYHTQLLGSNYTNCTAANAQVLFGGFGVSWVTDLTGGVQYADVECLDITSHSQQVSGTPGICVVFGTTLPCDTSVGSGLSDYDGDGIETDNQMSHVLFQDVWINGHTASGIHGAVGGPITLTRVNSSYNGFAGWNFDDSAHDANASGSSISATSVTMMFNGCNQEYPIVDTYPAKLCFDDSSGGFGDAWSGQQSELDAFTCISCVMMYNTKDGFMGPHTTIETLVVKDSVSIGNMGQQWKWGSTTNSSTTFLNNLTVGNCNRMSASLGGVPSGFNAHLSDYCRAAGDMFSFYSNANSTVLIANNTIVGYNPVFFDLNCGVTNTCGTAPYVFKNNLILGYLPRVGGSTPTLYYFSDASDAVTSTYNLEYGVTGDACSGSITCADPLLTGEPSQASHPPPESNLDVFSYTGSGFIPTAGSPVTSAGTTYTGLLSFDFYNNPFTSPPPIGAVVPTPSVSPSTIIFGSHITLGQGLYN